MKSHPMLQGRALLCGKRDRNMDDLTGRIHIDDRSQIAAYHAMAWKHTSDCHLVTKLIVKYSFYLVALEVNKHVLHPTSGHMTLANHKE